MKIYNINPSMLQMGRDVCAASLRCGAARGAALVPGAIVEAIKQGLTTSTAIISVVTSCTRCLDTTVCAFLLGLDTAKNANGLWTRNADGEYRLTEQPVQTFTIMAQ